MTIDSDSEDTPLPKFTVDKGDTGGAPLNPELVFDLSSDPYINFDEEKVEDLVKQGTKPVSKTSAQIYHIVDFMPLGSNFCRRHHCTPTIDD